MEKIKDEYVNALCEEIEFRLKKYKVDSLKTIYIGGGTPSLLSYTQLKKILNRIAVFLPLNGLEITIELNPDDISEELLTNLNTLGINRISCGIQSMNDKALKFAGRRASRDVNLKALDILNNWNGILSLDLICGLPEETKETFIAGLNEIIKYNPEHISMYSLTIEDETPFGIALNNGSLDYDFDASDNLWLEGKRLLEESGYYQYEVSNFCKTDFECRHNLSYWNHQNYIGCGSGGTGTVYNKDGTGIRWTNSTDICTYTDYWNNRNTNEKIPEIIEEVDFPNSSFEFFMMGLRKISGINTWDYEEIFSKHFPEKVLSIAESWQKKDLCIIKPFEKGMNISLGPKGILFLNKFLKEIM